MLLAGEDPPKSRAPARQFDGLQAGAWNGIVNFDINWNIIALSEPGMAQAGLPG